MLLVYNCVISMPFQSYWSLENFSCPNIDCNTIIVRFIPFHCGFCSPLLRQTRMKRAAHTSKQYVLILAASITTSIGCESTVTE